MTKDEIIVEELAKLEKVVLEKAAALKAAGQAKLKASADLTEAIGNYDERRINLHREMWDEARLSWCHGCKDFCSVEQIVLVYSEFYQEDRPGELTEEKKAVQSYCPQCAEMLLSSRRGNNEFFKARKSGNAFEIFIYAQWKPLPEAEKVKIEVGITEFPIKKLSFGKDIRFSSWPSEHLTIGDEKFEF